MKLTVFDIVLTRWRNNQLIKFTLKWILFRSHLSVPMAVLQWATLGTIEGLLTLHQQIVEDQIGK